VHVCTRSVRVPDQPACGLRVIYTYVQAAKEVGFLRIRLHIISKLRSPSGSNRGGGGGGGTHIQVSLIKQYKWSDPDSIFSMYLRVYDHLRASHTELKMIVPVIFRPNSPTS